MGKGDKRTTRGKLFKGSYGNSRSRRTNRPVKAKVKR
jgi:ribosomal small subunit protein bTHX